MPVDPGTFTLELDTTTARLATPVWVDVTEAFAGFADQRRRTGRRFWDPYATARGAIDVRDETDSFALDVVDRAKIRFSITRGGVTRRLYTGTIWNAETVAVLSTTTRIRRLTCYDAYADFNEATVDTTAQIDAGRMDVWAGRVLDRYGFPGGRRNFEPARTNAPDYTGMGLATVAQLLRFAEQAEGGNIWVQRDGTVRFVNRDRLNQLDQVTPLASFGEDQLPVSNIQVDRGSRNLLNQQTVEPTANQFSTVTVPDPADGLTEDQTRVGIKPGTLVRNPLISNTNQATSIAGLRVRFGRTPPERASFVTQLEATNETTGEPGFESVFQLDVGEVVSCDFPRQGFQGNCYIEGMALTFNRQANSWRARLSVARTPSEVVFTLADGSDPMDMNGILETNTNLGF